MTEENTNPVPEENIETLAEELNKLRHLFIFHEESGVCLYYHAFTPSKIDPQLISGFLAGLSAFGAQFLDAGTKKKTKKEGQDLFDPASGIKELVYGEFRVLVETRGPCKVAMLVAGKETDILKRKMIQFIDAFMQTYKHALKNWMGNVRVFKDVKKIVLSVFGLTNIQGGVDDELNKLRHLFVFYKYCGETFPIEIRYTTPCLYYHHFTDKAGHFLDMKIDPQQISGMLAAFSSLGEQDETTTEKQDAKEEDNDEENATSELKELVYMQYRVLIESRGPCIFAVLIVEQSSDILNGRIAQFINQFMQAYDEALMDWNGNVRVFKDVDKIIRSVFSRNEPQVEEKSTRINLIIPESLKSEWEQFSNDVVHASMSQMIRDAVREYMKKKKQSEQQEDTIPVDQENQALDKKIEEIIAKKLKEMLKK